MSATLEMTQHHHTAKVSDVQRIGRRVDAEICCHLLFLQQFVGAWHHLVNHATPCEFFNKILHISVFVFIVVLNGFSVCMPHGTGSYPEPPQGWHLRMRRMPSHNPFNGPCLMIACLMYSEHVGVKRHDAGV